MVIMEHPNGCVHNVRDDLVDNFKAAGWKVKAAPKGAAVPAEQKKKTRSKK